jgi:SNF2 family DNA or RNA helicase
MTFCPYAYQQYAINRMIAQDAFGCFLDCGMGKSVITLTAVDALLYEDFAVNRVLIIAPLQPVKNTWPQELAKWDHLRHLTYSTAIGDAATRTAAVLADTDICVINVDNVSWLVEQHKKHWPFDMVVIDELSCFKSPSSARFRALRKVRKHIKRIVGLTGTPAPNGLIDLWPQMFLLDGGVALGRTVTGYREQYFLPDKRGQQMVYSWKPKPDADAQIYSRLAGTCVSMKSADYLDLPERLDVVHSVTLPEQAKAKYDQLEREMLLPFADGVITAGTAAILAGKLLQMTGGAAYDSEGNPLVAHCAKLDALAELIDEANGQPVLVFYGYKHELERIKMAFPIAVDVKTPGVVERWNAREIPILLAHPASAGHGLNLQHGGHLAIWYSLPWSLELYQQANKRLHRIGQTSTVLIHHIAATGTIDDHVMAVLRGKDKTQSALIDALRARKEELI